MRIGKKYIDLLKDPDVRRWYDNLARGSQATADVRLRGIGRFCARFGTSPKEFLQKSEKEISDLLMDYVTELDAQGKAGSYIESCLRPVRSWLKYNTVVLTRPIKIKNAKIPTTLHGQRTPSQEQLKKIIQSGTRTSRVCIALVSQSGLRLEVLGDYQGKDGLRLGDFPELVIGPEAVQFKVIPARVVVRPSLSKAGHEFFSFIGPEGSEYILDYLNERARKGEKLKADSPLVIPRNQKVHFISTINIGDQIRTAIRKAGFSWRPYDLRHYFATQTLEAESKATGLVRDYRVFFMGHKGDIEHQYTLNNRTLSNEKIEDMRSAYSKALRYIETEHKEAPWEDQIKALREHSLMAYAAMTGSEVSDQDKERLLSLEESDFWNEISEMFRRNRANIMNNGKRHKTISEKDLESYLEEGWELVQIYPRGDKAVIRLP